MPLPPGTAALDDVCVQRDLPGPTIHARYGEPIVVRFQNDLPPGFIGFGVPQTSTHLHNAHTPSESDGFPGDFFNSGFFKDHHYSITIKPNEDTPQVLREYAAMHGADPGWLFVTGDAKDIDMLRRTLGFADRDPIAALDAASHIGMILYGNEPLNRWAACPALGNPEQIYRSVLWMEGQMPGMEAK